MTMAEKILARHLVDGDGDGASQAGRRRCACASTAATRTSSPPRRCTPSSTRSTATATRSPTRPSSPSSRTTSSTPTACRAWRRSRRRSRCCATCSAPSRRKTGVQDFSADDGISPGICHTIAREQIIEPGDFIQATDSHTCMGGVVGALAYGVGATEYAALIHAGFTFVVVPESIRFELTGALQPGVTAKDVMLYILANHAQAAAHARPRDGVRRPGPGVAVARRARHARQHGDRVLGEGRHRRGRRRDAASGSPRAAPARRSTTLRARVVAPDRGAQLRRRRAHHRPVDDPPDGGDARRRGQGHPVRPDQRRLHRRARRRADRHRLRRLVHRRQGRRHRHVRARDAGGAPPPAAASPTASTSTSSSARGPSRTTRARSGYLKVFQETGRQGDLARLRRLHRLRAGRLGERRSRSSSRRSTATTRAARGPVSCTWRHRSTSPPRPSPARSSPTKRACSAR